MAFEDAYALVIGISRYQHEPVLRATQDAQDVAAALADPAFGGYAPAAVQTLLDEAATRTGILAALDALARTARASSTVFIYYSGHGARTGTPGDRAYYLVPVDAAGSSHDELEKTAISNTELSARLKAIPAGRLTVVLDCCRAADVADTRLGDAVAAMGQGGGRVILAASRAAGSAFSLPGQRDSVLTGFLVEGLRGAAPGVGGVIRICDLFHYVQQQVAGQPVDQHPVFKAELEENYPIALFRGGQTETFKLPPPPDDSTYDAFLSYCHDDNDDRAWARTVLVPTLERLGLKLCLEHRDFRLGASRIDEIERAVLHSRYTIGIFTPAYLTDPLGVFDSLLAAQEAIESQAPCFIPLLRRACKLALHTRMTEILDVRHDDEVASALQRLALALRESPRPRLT